MFKAMARSLSATGVVGGRHSKTSSSGGESAVGAGAPRSRHGSGHQPALASLEVRDHLEPWMEEDPEDFDPDAFAATHYGDASEKRIRHLSGALGALRERADAEMRHNVLAHRDAFVRVSREISRAQGRVAELRDLVAVPTNAVESLLHDSDAGVLAAAALDEDVARRDARRRAAAAAAANGVDGVGGGVGVGRAPAAAATTTGGGIRRVDARAAAELIERLEAFAAERDARALLDEIRRGDRALASLQSAEEAEEARRVIETNNRTNDHDEQEANDRSRARNDERMRSRNDERMRSPSNSTARRVASALAAARRRAASTLSSAASDPNEDPAARLAAAVALASSTGRSARATRALIAAREREMDEATFAAKGRGFGYALDVCEATFARARAAVADEHVVRAVVETRDDDQARGGSEKRTGKESSRDDGGVCVEADETEEKDVEVINKYRDGVIAGMSPVAVPSTRSSPSSSSHSPASSSRAVAWVASRLDAMADLIARRALVDSADPGSPASMREACATLSLCLGHLDALEEDAPETRGSAVRFAARASIFAAVRATVDAATERYLGDDGGKGEWLDAAAAYVDGGGKLRDLRALCDAGVADA